MRNALIAMASLALTTSAAAAELDIHQGRMQAGGQATITIGDYGGGIDAGVLIAPNVGYMLTHEVELLAGAQIGVNTPDVIGLSAGARYLSPTAPLVAYGGGQLGFADFSGFSAITITGMGGVLVPLTPDVGLDLGARLNINIFPDSDTTTWDIPIGYLGVQGFFDLGKNKGRGTGRDPRQTPLE